MMFFNIPVIILTTMFVNPTRGLPNVILILTDDQDLLLNGLVRIIIIFRAAPFSFYYFFWFYIDADEQNPQTNSQSRKNIFKCGK